MGKEIKVKQGTERRLGGILGIAIILIFGGIGLFVVIPSFGLFGIFWTLMAVVMGTISIIQGFSKKPFTKAEISVENAEFDVESRMKSVKNLYEKGMITKEEYDSKRKQILNSL